jgi:hypothetical protein
MPRRTTRKTKQRSNRIRIRTKRLDQVDESKLALALWLMAQQAIEDQTQRPLLDTRSTRRRPAS